MSKKRCEMLPGEIGTSISSLDGSVVDHITPGPVDILYLFASDHFCNDWDMFNTPSDGQIRVDGGYEGQRLASC